jgi:hypothetical protein
MNILRFGASIAIASLAVTGARADGPAISYVPGSMVQSKISYGPWTLHEQGTIVRRDWFDVDTIPDPFAHDASGIVPTTSGPPYAGAGTPYAGYCDAGGKPTVNHGFNLMQPYYFPFVRKRGPVLEGYFDYRPRNQQEATVAAVSTDWGATWFFTGKALALNPYCPWDPTDPDNLNISVNGVKTAYGSSSANAADNGLGHPTVLSVNGKQHIYTLNRANNHIDSDQLVVHELPQWDSVSLFTLPAYGFVSPIASGGYPALDATAKATTGLQNPDAAIGSVELGKTTAVVYVEKTLNADTSFPASEVCPSTPAFALTNLVNKKPRKANHDVIAVRVATTMDGINFTDAGSDHRGPERHPLARLRQPDPHLRRPLRHVLRRRQLPRQRLRRLPLHRLCRDGQPGPHGGRPADMEGHQRARQSDPVHRHRHRSVGTAAVSAERPDRERPRRRRPHPIPGGAVGAARAGCTAGDPAGRLQRQLLQRSGL